jgi:hypothetical protein
MSVMVKISVPTEKGEENEKHPNKRQLPALEAFRYEELYPICV